MFLFELFNTDPLTVRLVAVTSQLVSDIDSGSQHAKWTVDELLDYFKINDINSVTTSAESFILCSIDYLKRKSL